jgi:hypothetical protein
MHRDLKPIKIEICQEIHAHCLVNLFHEQERFILLSLEMPSDDKDSWTGGENNVEMSSDVQLKTKPEIKLLSVQVCPLDVECRANVWSVTKL